MIRTPAPRRVLKILWIILPLLVCLVIMLPRIQSAQFGLFDDGVTISKAREILRGDWSLSAETDTGRFRPAYWLYFTLIYVLAGADPKAFFIGNLFLLLATTAVLILLARKRGAGWFIAGLAGLLFVLAGPVIENYYTLSKGEALQLLGILLFLLLSYTIVENHRFWIKLLAMIGAVLALLVAFVAKETTLAIVVLTAGWMALALLYRILGQDRRSLSYYWVVFATALLGGGLFLVLRSLFVPVGLTGGSYTGNYQLTIGALAASVLRWTGWLLRDYNYLLPVLGVALAWSIAKKRFRLSLDDLDLLVWIGAWMVIFLPWAYTAEYYMLPFAVGIVLFGSRLVERLFVDLSQSSRGWRLLTIGAYILSGLLLLFTLPNNISNGRVQLAMDAANASMLSYLAENVPQDGEVVINMPADLEFVYEIRLHLNHLYDRPDIQTDRFFFQGILPGQGTTRSYTLITPWIEKSPRHSVRVGVYEQGAREWLRVLQDYLGGTPDAVWQDQLEYRLLVIDLPRLFCPLIGPRNFCAQPGSVISWESFRYGWQVYPVLQDAADLSQPGTFRSGEWTLRTLDGEEITRKFGQVGDLPMPGDWDGDGTSDLGVYRPDDLTWHLETSPGGSGLVFTLPDLRNGDIPLNGDWDGDGRDTPAFYRPEDGSWYFYNLLPESGMDISPDLIVPQAGQPGDQPLVGDWDGDGQDTFGLYRPDTGTLDLENSFQGGLQGVDLAVAPGSIIVPGRWGARPGDTFAIWAGGVWTPVLVLCDCQPSNPPKAFNFGSPEDIPVQGVWQDQ